MDTASGHKPSKGFGGMFASLSKSLRGLSGRKAAPPPAPTRERLGSLPEEVAATSQDNTTNPSPRPSSHGAHKYASSMHQPSSTTSPASSLQTATSTASTRISRGDSASSTTISHATSPVAMANMRVRQDLATLGKALETLYHQVRGSSPLAAWQVEALRTRFQVMAKLAGEVNRHEEECLFPLVRKHPKLLETLQCQSTNLTMLWSGLRKTVGAMQLTQEAAADAEVLREIMASCNELQIAAKAHWQEIDTKLLPIVYNECSEKEIQRLDARLLRDPSQQDWAHLLSVTPNEKLKKATLKHMGASGLTTTLVLAHGCKQYAKHVGPLFVDLRNGCPGEGRSKSASSSNNGFFAGGVGFSI